MSRFFRLPSSALVVVFGGRRRDSFGLAKRGSGSYGVESLLRAASELGEPPETSSRLFQSGRASPLPTDGTASSAEPLSRLGVGLP